MEDVDTLEITDFDDEHEMFMHHVVGEEHELIFLDSYLREAFAKPEKENTI